MIITIVRPRATRWKWTASRTRRSDAEATRTPTNQTPTKSPTRKLPTSHRVPNYNLSIIIISSDLVREELNGIVNSILFFERSWGMGKEW